jgi:NitT/TauT family transport system substrate-binding protein
MAGRLTPLSKALIAFLIVGGLFMGGRYVVNNTSLGDQIRESAQSDGAGLKSRKSKRDDNTLRVQLVTWGGYAPGLLFNEGSKPNDQSRFFKEYGFNVDFVVENDLITAMNAWMAGEYDILVQTADAFPLYTAPDDINAFKPQAFMQVDWSRGGDAIIVKRGIHTVNDLKGKRIAVATPSPAQTLLVSSLEAAGLDYKDVTIVKTDDNIRAAELFRTNDIDAAVVWSPDDILATQDVPGSKILLTTREQSHIIADIMFASESFIRENQDKVNGFYEGWMKGVAELNANEGNRNKAARFLAELNGLPVDDALFMMDNVYFTGHEDNINFFGLNPEYKGQRGNDLYTKMSTRFVAMGDADKIAPTWRSVINTSAIMAAQEKLKGQEYQAEKPKVFEKKADDVVAPAFSSKPVTINFPTARFELDPNAKTIIDLQFGEIARTFANTKIRVEGNTDSVGARDMNMRLSKQRAQSVANYLIETYGLDPNRIVIVGNGPDKPMPGCERNDTEDCRSQNRRTEFQLIQN